jgi:hypothetical protein
MLLCIVVCLDDGIRVAGTAAAVHPRKSSSGRSCPMILYTHREKETRFDWRQRHAKEISKTAAARRDIGGGGGTQEKNRSQW